MANELKLQNPLSSDRKPVKVNTDSTGLLLKDKDVIVEGNLEIEGSITTDINATENLTVKKDLIVNGAQYNTEYFYHGGDEDTYLRFLGNRFIHVAGNTSIFDSNNEDFSVGSGKFYVDITGTGNVGVGVTDPDAQLEVFGTSTQLKLSHNANDYATFAVADTGDLTIATVGDGTRDSDFIIDADGSITLDSASGAFIAKNNNTEFSVANSAYAGMILGYTTAGIYGIAQSYTLDTTMTTINDNLNVSFKAPPSGVVEIFAQIYFDTSRRTVVLGLSDQDTTDTYQAISFPNATDETNEHVQAVPPTANGDSILRPHWVVTGLTAGTTYKWWLGAKITAGTGGVLRWGGAGTGQYPPFIMKATALPAAVTDFAVYG